MAKKMWEVVLPEEVKNGRLISYDSFSAIMYRLCQCNKCPYQGDVKHVSCEMCLISHLFQDAPEPKKVMRGSLIRSQEDLNRMVDEWKASASSSTPYQSFADFLGDMIPDPAEVEA